MLVRVAAEMALMFEPLVPHAETVEAMKAARRGEVVKAGNATVHARHASPDPARFR